MRTRLQITGLILLIVGTLACSSGNLTSIPELIPPLLTPGVESRIVAFQIGKAQNGADAARVEIELTATTVIHLDKPWQPSLIRNAHLGSNAAILKKIGEPQIGVILVPLDILSDMFTDLSQRNRMIRAELNRIQEDKDDLLVELLDGGKFRSAFDKEEKLNAERDSLQSEMDKLQEWSTGNNFGDVKGFDGFVRNYIDYEVRSPAPEWPHQDGSTK